jgi:hypothetical protein
MSITLNFKSKTGLCMAAQPGKAFIINVNKDGKELSRTQIGKEYSDTCPYCNELWSEH